MLYILLVTLYFCFISCLISDVSDSSFPELEVATPPDFYAQVKDLMNDAEPEASTISPQAESTSPLSYQDPLEMSFNDLRRIAQKHSLVFTTKSQLCSQLSGQLTQDDLLLQ